MVSRSAARRAAVEREILDAAWTLMAADGAAALNVREVARMVGLRQQSLTYYFPSKRVLLDALFADGFSDLRAALEAVAASDDPVEDVVAVALTVVEYCLQHPARYQLLLQRSVPAFAPSEASLRISQGCLAVLGGRLDAAGVTGEDDVALIRALISGAASEQLANEPTGRQFVDQVGRGVRVLVEASARTRISK